MYNKYLTVYAKSRIPYQTNDAEHVDLLIILQIDSVNNQSTCEDVSTRTLSISLAVSHKNGR